jgi:hypothetical protein
MIRKGQIPDIEKGDVGGQSHRLPNCLGWVPKLNKISTSHASLICFIILAIQPNGVLGEPELTS